MHRITLKHLELPDIFWMYLDAGHTFLSSIGLECWISKQVKSVFCDQSTSDAVAVKIAQILVCYN